jgi:hypothetical protein
MSVMSQPFQKLERLKSTFSGGTTIPAEVVFRKSDIVEGGYALDSAKSNDGKNILLYLVCFEARSGERIVNGLQGTVLEKYLTLPPETFGSLLKGSDKPPPEEQREQYRYAKVGVPRVTTSFTNVYLVVQVCDALTIGLL